MKLASAALAALLAAASARPASAEPAEPRVDLHAGTVDLERGIRELRLRRNVVVTFDRFRLTSQDLRLRLPEAGGLEADGPGRVALCLCPDPPVAFAFERLSLSPAGDLRATWPRVEAFGVPVIVAPWIWIRPPDRVGILPPIVAWRGDGGLLLGGGVHLPWRAAVVGAGALDLTAAGFTRGGVAIGARARTPTTRARVEGDRLGGDRLLVEARGVLAAPWAGPSAAAVRVAWDVDAIRGARARAGTIALDPAARPLDAAVVEASARGGLGHGAAAFGGAGVAAIAARGLGPIAVGPVATAAAGGPLGRAGAWSALATGFAAAGDAVGDATLPVARAALDAEVAPRAGPFAIRITTRESARFAGRGASIEPVTAPRAPLSPSASADAVASGRVAVGLPLVRAFDAPLGEAPLVHRVEPVVEARGALAAGHGSFFAPIGGALPPASYVIDGGVATSIGRWGGAAVTLDARVGAFGDGAAPRPVAHGRLGASAPVVGASVEAAVTGGQPAGAAIVGRGRLGRVDRLRLIGEVAALGGAGAREARGVAGGTAAWGPGDALAYAAGSGVWGRAGAVVPVAPTVTARLAADADLGAPALLAVRGELGWRHPCGCLGVTAIGAGRDGRPGVDAWLEIELAPR